MFRKPKSKSAIRQRTSTWDDKEAVDDANFTKPSMPSIKPSGGGPLPESVKDCDEEDVKPSVLPVSKPTSLLSFDNDEGADVDIEFKVKKSKKHLKEIKKLKKLEEKAKELEIKQEINEEILTMVVKPVNIRDHSGKTTDKISNGSKSSGSRRQDGDHQRDRPERKFKREDDFLADKLREEENMGVQDKFPSSFSGIPDSRAVYEARKRREKLRKEGYDGYIPLDDDQKLREKGVRDRLVREDDNDDSDEDQERFYSSRTHVMEEENRRREEQSHFLEKEQGEGRSDDDEREDEWEKQQILKAVGRNTIGQIKQEYEQTAEYFRRRREEDDERRRPIEMDVDMDIEDEGITVIGGHGRTGEVNPGSSHVTMEDIMAKLKLRLNDREECLNTLRQSVQQIDTNIQENKENIRQLELAGPVIADKFRMYQSMKLYVRSLLDCLNEKVGDINGLVDKRRFLAKARAERLARRRRRDVRDAYDECSAAAAGKNPSLIRIGDHGIRAAERDGRRARRRREREGQLSGISHEEGLSSDDEETTSQTMADAQIEGEINAALDTVFVDALEEYSSLRKVLDRIVDWLSVDGKSFEDAYVHLCIPKLAAPFVRMQLARANVLNNSSFRLDTMQWYLDVLMAGSESEVEPEHHIVVGLVPAIVEKVVVPFLTDVVNEEWDPLSLKQSNNLGFLLKTLISDYPTMTSKSKPVIRLVEAIQRRVKESTDDDLFVPMYAKQAIENSSTGCRMFLDRQFWTAIKLMRCVNSLSCLLSPFAMAQMVLECIGGRPCALALQMGDIRDQGTISKVRALIGEIRVEWVSLISENSTRSLISCLLKVADEYDGKNKDFSKEVRRFADKLKKK